MFEEFSAGYFIGQLYVEPYDGTHAAMDSLQHEEANELVYPTGEEIEQTNYPLVMKLDQHHFPVLGTDTVPTDTLAVPKSLLTETLVTDPPSLCEILIAKADRAASLLEWLTPYTITEPDFS